MLKNGLTNLAFQKFKKSFWGVISFWFIILVGFISVFAYVIAPDSSQYSNQMHLSIHSKSPGFSVQMLVVPSSLDSNQNLFNRLFFGNSYPPKEIPISSYRFDDKHIYYSEYASFGLKELEKSIKLSDNTNSSLPFVFDPASPFFTELQLLKKNKLKKTMSVILIFFIINSIIGFNYFHTFDFFTNL